MSSLVAGEKVRSFIPFSLPPQPPLELSAEDTAQFEAAGVALGRLDGLASLLPLSDHLVYSFLRKEAQLSSVIEGSRTSLHDLFAFETDSDAASAEADTREVARFVEAAEFGFERLQSLPLSLRLIREVHGRLFAASDGKAPGEFRTNPVWAGGRRPSLASLVPVPPERLVPCMSDLEEFIHRRKPAFSPLLRAGLVHVQFETIHPFLDGNGRVGRLLITLMLCAEGVLSRPVLYLSLFFKRNRLEYYERLDAVRTTGDWEGWLRFFCRGVESTALEGTQAAQRILAVFQRDESRVEGLGRSRHSAALVLRAFMKHPVLSIGRAAALTGLSAPTAANAMRALAELGLIAEQSGGARNLRFVYGDYLRILSEGTEPY